MRVCITPIYDLCTRVLSVRACVDLRNTPSAFSGRMRGKKKAVDPDDDDLPWGHEGFEVRVCIMACTCVRFVDGGCCPPFGNVNAPILSVYVRVSRCSFFLIT